jgi:hypothetical protein
MQVELVLFLDGTELDIEFIFGFFVSELDHAVSCRIGDFEVFEVYLLSDVSFLLFVEQYFVIECEDHV